MALQAEELELVFYPDPVLRRRASTIETITDEVRQVALRMVEIMRQAPGVGLAGPQVGLSWRLFVANASGDPNDNRVFINPVLSQPSREQEEYEEGCLSLPNVTAPIRRPKAITIQALDLEGQPFELTSDELPARVWQHEYDHLEGVLILDRMSEIDKMANKQVLRELERDYQK